MEAKQKQILEFLSTSNTQFTIPVYQRNYDWDEKQCFILLDDIFEVAENPQIISHFMGSIVYLHEGAYTTGKKEFSIIDGQQRLTTITLLLIVIYHKAKEFGNNEIAEMIYERYLTDKHIKGDIKVKIILPGKNFRILKNILEDKFYDLKENEKDNNLFNNYNFFIKEVQSLKTINKIITGIEKLIYVDIALERGKDDPQKIFESLNSTGLDLSQADLIRNFILMNLSTDQQNRIYEDYWVPIEENTKFIKLNKTKSQISEFLRDFLTLQLGKISNKNKVFEEFKNNYTNTDFDSMQNELEIIKNYSRIYSFILNPDKQKDTELRDQFRYLKSLDQNVINPFIMGIYNDYEKNVIEKKTLIKVMELIQNYIWRRYICNEPSNALNKIFMNLYTKIVRNDYFQSIENVILKQNFPDDKRLKENLKIKSIYDDRDKLLYLFEKLENFGHNELVNVYSENISIEHIFPQKPNKIWKENISESEFDKMDMLKHTLANLTLTGSNSNLGNKSFLEKRDMSIKGYKDSKLFLNKWISLQSEWNLTKMDERFNEIFNTVIRIWVTPNLEKEENINEDIFYCQGARGYGTGKLINNRFKILKGSRASKILYNSAEKYNEKTFRKLIDQGTLKEEIDFFIFLSDYTVSSPSAAAKLILGRSANGWSEWKTYEGKSLDDFRVKE